MKTLLVFLFCGFALADTIKIGTKPPEAVIVEVKTYSVESDGKIVALMKSDGAIDFPTNDSGKAFKALWKLYQSKPSCNYFTTPSGD